MKIATILAALAALVVAVAAAAAGPVNGTDRANAARACSALRTANATAFKTQYATFGACTSAWAQRAHAARVAAQAACKAKGLSGSQYASCVKSTTNSTLATQTTTYKNAAKACAAELAAGKAAFMQKYGTAGSNLRNAFGKCVSKQASSKSTSGHSGGSSTPKATHYAVTLTQLNGSGAAGSGSLLLNKNVLTVKLSLTGLEAGQSHTVSINGLSSGSAACPTSSADTDGDGTISNSEGAATYGNSLLALDSSAQSGSPVTVASSLLPLQTRAIVVFGKTVNGVYDSTVPVACGTISSK